MIETVVNHVLDRDTPYQRLLYSAISDRYAAAPGRIEDAIARQRTRGSGPQLLHLHWEERDLGVAPTATEAVLVVDYMLEALDEFAALGGKIVWTVQSETLSAAAPNEAHDAAFLSLRRGLMRRADRICVHNLRTIEILRAQSADEAGPPAEKLYLSPHPSFAGAFAAALRVGDAPPKKVVLLRQFAPETAVTRFLEAFEMSGAGRRGIEAHILGAPLARVRANGVADAELKRKHGRASGVVLRLERVDAADAFAEVASAACLAVTDAPSLTVSEAFAAMTCGVPIVGPDVSQLREALPAENHPYLYNPDHESDVMARIDALLSLSAASRAALETALRTRAEDHHPAVVSRRLGLLYDDLSA